LFKKGCVHPSHSTNNISLSKLITEKAELSCPSPREVTENCWPPGNKHPKLQQEFTVPADPPNIFGIDIVNHELNNTLYETKQASFVSRYYPNICIKDHEEP
jgi:hypothetical protein